MQEVALGGGAEGPHVTVVSVLPPAGLIGTDHRTASDPFHDVGHDRLGSVGHPWCGGHDGAHAETPTMHRSQVPLDGTEGQPGLFPQRGNQADQVDPQALLAQHHLVQLRRGNPPPLALGAGAGDIGVLGYLHRNLGQLDDLPSALGPAAGQLDPTIGTPLQRVLHTLVGRHSGSGKARATGLARLPGSIRLPVAFGLQAGHPSRTAGLALALQLGDPLLQAFNDGLLSDDDADEHIPVGSPEINFTVHPSYMT